MADRVIEKSRLAAFVSCLMAEYVVIAPKREHSDLCFGRIDDPAQIVVDYKNTTVSPKEFFWPQTEPLLRYDVSGKVPQFSAVMPPKRKTLLFGVRPCDAGALVCVDKPYQEKFPDPHYLVRREQTAIVTLACNEACNAYAFCHSIKGGPWAQDGFDLQLYDLGDRYLAESGSEQGEKLLKRASAELREAGAQDLEAKNAAMKHSLGTFSKHVGLEHVPENLQAFFDAVDMWERFAETCIRCGGCNYICPTCHCFNVTDYTDAKGQGKRVRNWDSCMLGGFARMAGPQYVREEVLERLRQRVYHKFHIYPERFGLFGCTGCGRCIASCPVEIDLADILNAINNRSGDA